jgi:Histidine kinase-, DNA gyrase B-, and HSP90-like ATPase
MARAPKARYEENPPDPGATVESLRAIGYDLSMAIADVIDNSISARASTVRILANWNGGDSTISVVDDGAGLSDSEVVRAMRLGSSDATNDRIPGDLGRFGFGLKTASFSQCRELTVVSHTAPRSRAIGSWDLDHLRSTSSWQLRLDLPQGVANLLSEIWPKNPPKGTAVIWRRLDRLVPDNPATNDLAARGRFLARLSDLATDLGMVFHRFISTKRLSLLINGSPVTAWDPFSDAEQLSFVRRVAGQSTVDIAAWIVRRRDRFGVELQPPPGGWSKRQGIYVYRCDRLISTGGWLNTRERVSDRYDRARLEISVGNELDHLWHLDVKKSTVEIPANLLEEITTISKLCRRRAIEREGLAVGRADRPQKKGVMPMWTVTAQRGTNTFRLERKHPMISVLRKHIGDDLAEGILTAIESSLPVDFVPRRPSPRPLRKEPLPDSLLVVARSIVAAEVVQGVARAAAVDYVASQQPFSQFPDTLERLKGDGAQ